MSAESKKKIKGYMKLAFWIFLSVVVLTAGWRWYRTATEVIAGIALLLFVMVLMAAGDGGEYGEGRNRSMDWHRRNGTHRVVYTDTIMPDGEFAVSQPMSREVAGTYASLNDGVVIRVNGKPPKPSAEMVEAYRAKQRANAERDKVQS